jgi:hypothetical protein
VSECRELTDLLVGVLAGETLGNTGHDDVLTNIMLAIDCQFKAGHLRGHEGELVVDMALDDLGVDNESGGDVVYRN